MVILEFFFQITIYNQELKYSIQPGIEKEYIYSITRALELKIGPNLNFF